MQSGTEIVTESQTFLDDARAALHVFDGLASFALNALDEVGNFLGGLRGLLREFAHFIGDNGEAKTVLAGTGRFDGSVKCEQVGLFGQVIDNFNDLSDVIGAMTEDVDDFRGRLDGLVGAVEAVGGLLHGLNAGNDFLAGAVGDLQQNLGGIGHTLNGSDHLIDGSGSFRDAGSLDLRILHDVLHVDAHLVHGAGDLFNCGRGLDADLGRLIGGARDLSGTSRDLAGGIARGSNEFLQTVGHAKEGIAESVALGTGHDFHGQVAFGDGHGDTGHFLEIGHHVVEGSGQSTDFVIAVNINVLIEVAGVANFASDGNEMGERLGDGFSGIPGNQAAGNESKKGTAAGHPGADSTGAIGGFRCFVLEPPDILIALVENDS